MDVRVKRFWDWKLDAVDSGSYLGAGVCIKAVQSFGSTTRYLVNFSDNLTKTDFEDGRWMNLAQDSVLWQTLVLTPLKPWVLLPES